MATRREFLKRGTAVASWAPWAPRATAVPAALRPSSGGRSAATVQTVLGPIPVDKLGYTLPHEHILASSPGFLQTWPELLGGRANFIRKVVAKLQEAKREGVEALAVERMTPDGLLFSTRKVIRYLREIGLTAAAIRAMTLENPRLFFARGAG